MAIETLLLVPVDINVWKAGTAGPPDPTQPDHGVIAQKGDALTICIDGTSQNPPSIAPNQPVWKISQMQSDGSYSSTWQQIGTGPRFDYTTTTSGVFELEAVFFGDDAHASKYLRKADETGQGQTVSYNKKGTPDAFGVTDTAIQIAIKHSAGINLGSAAYDVGTNHPPSFPPGSDKCNLFVADKCNDAGAIVPWINGLNPFKPYPPTANQWAGTDPKNIPNWTLLPANALPQPGFVVSDPNSLGSGHCGVLDYDGWGIGAGVTYHVSKRYPFFPESRQRQYSP
jgi:hypothetical protein